MVHLRVIHIINVEKEKHEEEKILDVELDTYPSYRVRDVLFLKPKGMKVKQYEVLDVHHSISEYSNQLKVSLVVYVHEMD